MESGQIYIVQSSSHWDFESFHFSLKHDYANDDYSTTMFSWRSSKHGNDWNFIVIEPQTLILVIKCHESNRTTIFVNGVGGSIATSAFRKAVNNKKFIPA